MTSNSWHLSYEAGSALLTEHTHVGLEDVFFCILLRARTGGIQSIQQDASILYAVTSAPLKRGCAVCLAAGVVPLKVSFFAGCRSPTVGNALGARWYIHHLAGFLVALLLLVCYEQEEPACLCKDPFHPSGGCFMGRKEFDFVISDL